MKNENDYIICKVCNEKVNRLYGAHLKKHNMTSDDYKRLYPDSPLTCKTDSKNTSKNSGLHMKTEKFKNMFAEKIKGDKNPNSKSKTTVQQRKERSPFSIEFHNNKKELEDFRMSVVSKKSYNNRIDYYLNKGYSVEESEKLLKERQTTFTVEKCIKKYGENEGIKIYTQRQERWLKSLKENGNLKNGYSKISQELFYKLLEYYSLDIRKYIFFATKNDELILEKQKGGLWLYDFADIKNKKIIEYNGDNYHANPLTYKSTDIPNNYKNETAQEIWDKDAEKLSVAKQKGYDVLVVWDKDYKKNKEEIIKKCLKFLGF
jgi:hypothetical protein